MYLAYCKNLSFEAKPDYEYLKNLFKQVAIKHKIDLNDKLYDWSVKATTLLGFPDFFDFSKASSVPTFNNQGEFKHLKSNDTESKQVVQDIYKYAPYYKFRQNPK